jgi:hypothetical protein
MRVLVSRNNTRSWEGDGMERNHQLRFFLRYTIYPLIITLLWREWWFPLGLVFFFEGSRGDLVGKWCRLLDIIYDVILRPRDDRVTWSIRK